MRPYLPNEAGDDPSMLGWNTSLSGLRTGMTENIFARIKGQWPVLTALRGSVAHCQDVVIATAILHNMLLLWDHNVPLPYNEMGDHAVEEAFIVLEDAQANPGDSKERGRVLRELLRAQRDRLVAGADQ